MILCSFLDGDPLPQLTNCSSPFQIAIAVAVDTQILGRTAARRSTKLFPLSTVGLIEEAPSS